MKYLPSIISLVCIALCSTSSARNWTDRKGRSMETDLVRIENGDALFLMSNGMRTRFAVADLSDADQNFIKENHSQ